MPYVYVIRVTGPSSQPGPEYFIPDSYFTQDLGRAYYWQDKSQAQDWIQGCNWGDCRARVLRVSLNFLVSHKKRGKRDGKRVVKT